MIVEICAPSVQSAVNAMLAGADRIELCQNLAEGGTTPSFAEIKFCAEVLQLPTNVLIRPRSGNFCYSDLEFDMILQDIELCKNLGINGIVVGVLLPDLRIDIRRMSQIMAVKGDLEVTFHRAFDLCKEREEGIAIIRELGCNRILTSGFEPSAYQGIDKLARLVELAKEDLQILAGAGINAENVCEIIQRTGVKEVHASCSKMICNEATNRVSTMDKSNYEWCESSLDKIKSLLTAVQNK